MVEEGWRQQVAAGAEAHAAGRLDAAIAHFAQAARLCPGHPSILFNLGIALEDAGRVGDALNILAEADRLRPDHPHTLFRLASLMAGRGEHQVVVEMLSRLLALWPDYPDAAFRLGNVLMVMERYEAAEQAYRWAVVLSPETGSITNNLAGALRRQGRVGEAGHWYRRAVRLDPGAAEYHKNLGACLIAQGNWREGWPHYDWRDRQPAWGWRRGVPGIPRWDGSPLAGKSILVHFEQGLGDTFQFIRYMRLLKQQGARTIFECQPLLRDILGGVPDIDQLVCHGDPLPPADMQVPLMSLPGLCGTDPDSVPGADGAYLRPPIDRVAEWGRRIGESGFRIGINGQASTDEKSIPLAAFAPLAALPGVRLFSLQQGVGAGQPGITCFPDADQDRAFGGFIDSAAIIANLDLVISCDSAMIHVAGAMGKTAFLALPWLADWRWLAHPERTCWYDCVRMFRSQANGGWEGVMTRITQSALALANLKFVA